MKHHTNTTMSAAQTAHATTLERSTNRFIVTIEPSTIAIEATVTAQPSHVAGDAP
jgi:hypothetical protein